MDPQLAMFAAQYLVPFLPALVAGATKYTESFMAKAGDESYEFAATLWAKLKGRRQSLDDAAQDVADHTDDQDASSSFRLQLKKLLLDEPELAQEITDMLKDRQVKVAASGERSVAMSGTMTSSTVITGDSNRVETGKDED